VLRPGIAEAKRTAPLDGPASRNGPPDGSARRLPGPRPRATWVRHLWLVTLIASFVFLSNRMVFALIGALNRRLRFISTVFVVYPGSDEILSRYCYGAVRDWAAWRPTLLGAYRQTGSSGSSGFSGSWGLMFGIASAERELDRPATVERLAELHARMETIRRTVRAREVRFAGVLPSRLCAEGIAAPDSEALAAVAALLQAETIVRSAEQIGESAPLIVLGANGLLGQQLTARLGKRTVYGVDVGPLGEDFANRASWPAHLTGRKALLINVARSDTLALYLDLLWSSLVVLNEVYPPPGPRLLQRLSALKCRCYHLAGAAGTAYPDLPWPYAGAIPCCAAQIDADTPLIVRRLA
jgi:hypothetical protein